MKKVSFFLTAIIGMALLVSASTGDPCPIETNILVQYNNILQPLPDSLCITVIWDFGVHGTCDQKQKVPTNSYGPVNTGTLPPVPFTLNMAECPGECLLETDVFSITVIISNCKGTYYSRTTTGYVNPINIKYF